MRGLLHIATASILAIMLGLSARAATPVVTDSRIKTFVYNENEVFTITTHYGYQSNIEFGEKETIDTVSVGDRVGWQIIPAGRRLFIRAMEENAHTNMTIVTNRRAYQFDLRSSAADAVFGSEELTYVVRFFYPDEGGSFSPANFIAPPAPMSSMPMTPVYAAPSVPVYAAPIAPSYAAPAPTYTPPPISYQQPAPPAAVNYRYTYSGPNEVAPVKIFDDGRSTYFKFRGMHAPRFAVITSRGEELSVPARQVDAETYAVDLVAPRFSLRESNAQVIVYNESNGTS